MMWLQTVCVVTVLVLAGIIAEKGSVTAVPEEVDNAVNKHSGDHRSSLPVVQIVGKGLPQKSLWDVDPDAKHKDQEKHRKFKRFDWEGLKLYFYNIAMGRRR